MKHLSSAVTLVNDISATLNRIMLFDTLDTSCPDFGPIFHHISKCGINLDIRKTYSHDKLLVDLSYKVSPFSLEETHEALSSFLSSTGSTELTYNDSVYSSRLSSFLEFSQLSNCSNDF